ncbi:MAG: sterol desaturase family protein [Endozoicomonas sp.]
MQSLKSTQAFRSRYRQSIHPLYNGAAHVLAVFTLGLGFIFLCLMKLDSVSAFEWLAIPVALLAFNVGEYRVHKNFGHRKVPWMKLFYQRHSGDHHTFFSNEQMTVDSRRDWRVVFFPVYLIFIISLLVALPLGYVVSLVFSENVGWLFAAAIVLGYLHYEVSHFVWHLPKKHSLFAIPFLAHMRMLHELHHHPDLRHEYNFNITWPMMDWLMKTYRPEL